MKKQIFCGRKDGATIKGKFYPHPRTSAILSAQLRRKSAKIERKLGRR